MQNQEQENKTVHSRPLKFRAWDKEEHEFEYIDFTDGGEVWCNTNWLPLQQFTGLLDKNGQEIYEKDIVKRTDKIIYGIVEYKHHMFYLNGIEDQDDYFNHANRYYEIIGNIYENPDLLTT